jgi:hypothetical protein
MPAAARIAMTDSRPIGAVNGLRQWCCMNVRFCAGGRPFVYE